MLPITKVIVELKIKLFGNWRKKRRKVVMSQYSAPERAVSYVVLIEYQYKFPY